MGFYVRRAVNSDLESIILELVEFSKFYAESFLDGAADTEHSRAVLKMLIDNHVCFVGIHDSEELAGFIIGASSPHLFNPNIKTLSELFWWTKEKYRNTRVGLMLLNEYIDFGKKNFNLITMILEDRSPVKPESLIKKGFKFKEQSYIMKGI